MPGVRAPRAANATANERLLESRNDVLRSLSTSVANIAARRDPEGTREDRDMAWSHLMGLKIKDIRPERRERVKLHFDKKVLEAIEGTWEP